MSHFSSSLQRVIETRSTARGAQTLFAREAGVEPASLSRYLNDESRPDVDVLEKLCAPLSEQHRAEIVIGYLRDDVPPSARGLIQIVSLIDSPRIADAAEWPKISLPKKVRDAFDFLESQAEHSQVVVEAILSTVALMRGKRD